MFENIGFFIFGVIVALGMAGSADEKSVKIGKTKLKGKWYKLTELD